jgi:hypothetical protein
MAGHVFCPMTGLPLPFVIYLHRHATAAYFALIHPDESAQIRIH